MRFLKLVRWVLTAFFTLGLLRALGSGPPYSEALVINLAILGLLWIAPAVVSRLRGTKPSPNGGDDNWITNGQGCLVVIAIFALIMALGPVVMKALGKH